MATTWGYETIFSPYILWVSQGAAGDTQILNFGGQSFKVLKVGILPTPEVAGAFSTAALDIVKPDGTMVEWMRVSVTLPSGSNVAQNTQVEDLCMTFPAGAALRFSCQSNGTNHSANFWVTYELVN